MSSFPFKTFLAALLASSCFVPVAQAATRTWGGSTGDWFASANWTGGALPGSADTAKIDVGTAIVDTVGSTATLTHLMVGHTLEGSLVVSEGGTLRATNVWVGFGSSVRGSMTVTGEESSLGVASQIFIGQDGIGELSILNGGTVFSNLASAVGNHIGSIGTLIVSGEGSTFRTINTNQALYVGNNGIGTLTVSDSGSVSLTSVLSLATNSTSTGTLNIGAAVGDAAAAPGAVTASSVVFGSGTGNIVFNHTSNNYIFANNISGAGTITNKAGTTNLTGDLSGFTGSFDLEGGTLSVVTSGVQTLSNSLTGSGTLAFRSGTAYLTGDSSGFTGTADVSGTGMLSVNGTLGGTVDVADGGRLQGSGTVGAIEVASGGTVAPGNSIGTLNVSGNVSFASGSIYEVEANATSSDKIVATGAATLTGGTVSLIPYQGALLRAGTTYTILSAAGGVSGAFDSVTLALNSLFLTPRLTYDANDVYASIVQSRSFASVAANGNQANTAAAIESLGAGSTLYDAVAIQSDAATTRQAFQSLDGEIHANVKASILEDQSAFGRILSGRLAQASDNETGLAAPVTAKASPRDRIMYGDKIADSAAASSAKLDPTLWAQGFGGWGRREGDANAANFKHQDKGLMTGVDWMLGDKWRMGLAFGYDRADYDQDDKTGASGTADRYSLSAYGGRSWGKMSLRTGLTYAYSDIDTKRAVSFPYFSDNLRASYNAHSVSGFAETAYAFGDKDSKAEPFANLAWGYVNVPGFTEQGGAAALTAKDSNETLGSTTLGARVRQVLPFLDTPKNKAAFQASAGWLHTIGNVSPDTSLRFATGSPFKTQAAPLSRDAAVLGAGVDYLIGQQTTLGVAYTGQIGEHADTQAVRGNVSYRF